MTIKRINVNSAVPGLMVADNVYNAANQLIVPKDAVLTDKAIARLHFHSIISIKIYDGISENSSASAPSASGSAGASVSSAASAGTSAGSDDKSYYEKLRDTEEFKKYKHEFAGTVKLMQSKIVSMLKNNLPPDTASLTESIRTLRSSSATAIQVFDLLHCMRNYDDITFAHSVNVALVSSVIADWLHFSAEETDVLIQCAIFHDIGKLFISKSISDKPSELTEDEFTIVKTHTSRGYNALRNCDIDRRVKLCAMMHHERCDGTGYPLRLTGPQIDSFAKIVMIADVYEAMTSSRIYRKPICPFEVLRQFELNGLSQFDPKYLLTFMENITQSYLGNKVRLNDGRQGFIVFINKLAYSKPMIKLTSNEYLDLSKTPGYYIDAIL